MQRSEKEIVGVLPFAANCDGPAKSPTNRATLWQSPVFLGALLNAVGKGGRLVAKNNVKVMVVKEGKGEGAPEKEFVLDRRNTKTAEPRLLVESRSCRIHVAWSSRCCVSVVGNQWLHVALTGG